PREPWYLKREDTVEWQESDGNQDSEGLVRIPPATLAQERADRDAFAKLPDVSEDDRIGLLKVLSEGTHLGVFSSELRSRGLAQKWHFYRLKAVIDRIRRWCQTEGLEWRNEWISTADTQRQSTHSALPSAATRERQHALSTFVNELSEEEIGRISVPLD